MRAGTQPNEVAVTMTPTGLAAFVSEHRFRLTLGGCVLALILMMALVHASVGLGPPWGGPVIAMT